LASNIYSVLPYASPPPAPLRGPRIPIDGVDITDNEALANLPAPPFDADGLPWNPHLVAEVEAWLQDDRESTGISTSGRTTNLDEEMIRWKTFHGVSRELPTEVIERIVFLAELGDVLLGSPRRRHPPIAYVCQQLRNTYLDQYSRFDFGIGRRRLKWGTPGPGRQRTPKNSNPTIRSALDFEDLASMIRFFNSGPGRPAANSILTDVEFVRIQYIDWVQMAGAMYELRSVHLAFRAFELLAKNAQRMDLRRIQLIVPTVLPDFGINSPGMWNLLKLRGIQAFMMEGRQRFAPGLVKVFARRLGLAEEPLWLPIGGEDPGQGSLGHRMSTPIEPEAC
jgi:hypothetical protein